MIFITCQKRDILLRDITKKQWVAKHETEQSYISEYTNMVKSCSAPNCQNREKKAV